MVLRILVSTPSFICVDLRPAHRAIPEGRFHMVVTTSSRRLAQKFWSIEFVPIEILRTVDFGSFDAAMPQIVGGAHG